MATDNGKSEIDLRPVKVYNVMPPRMCRLTITKSGGARFTKTAAHELDLEDGEPLLFMRNENDPADERIYMQFREHDDAIIVKEREGSFGFSGNGVRNAFDLPTDRSLRLQIEDPFVAGGELTYPLEIQDPKDETA